MELHKAKSEELKNRTSGIQGRNCHSSSGEVFNRHRPDWEREATKQQMEGVTQLKALETACKQCVIIIWE